MVGHLAGVKSLRNAYKILFIKFEGKYLRNQNIHERYTYMERTVRLASSLIKLHALMTYGEVEICIYAFVDGNGWLASCTRRYIDKMSIEQEAQWTSERV